MLIVYYVYYRKLGVTKRMLQLSIFDIRKAKSRSHFVLRTKWL